MLACLAIFHALNSHMEAGLNAYFLAGLDVDADRIAGPLKYEHLPAHLLLESQTTVRQSLGHFQDRSIGIIPERLDHRIGLIHQDLCPDLKISRLNAWIDIRVVLGSAYHNTRQPFRGQLEQRADTISRRRQLCHHLADLLEFDFTLLIGGLSQYHGMTELIQQLLSRV